MRYSKIWSTLEEETKKGSKQKYQSPKRRIITELFFSVDVKTYDRSLLIEINSDEVNEIGKIPEINGWSHSIVSRKISGSQKKYLQIVGDFVGTTNISEMVIGDLAQRIISLQKRDQLIIIISKTLKEWKLFFSSTDILSKNTEQGLVGELSWLHLMIRQGEDLRDVIENWTGSDKTRHDFEFNDVHFEIKTTTRKDRHVKISSEHQLNNKGLKKLYLVVYKYNVFSSNTPTLPELYDEIISLALNEPDLQNRIMEQCAKLGYNHSKKVLYRNKFELDGEVEIYKVLDKFPKLLKNTKMIGIDNISYSLDLDVCHQFSVDQTKVFPI
jgi:hypothetical protein